MWTLILILPGLVCAYFIFLRPVLKALPAFKAFYAEADTIEAKIWAVCGKSLTVAWSYFLMAVAALFNQLDNIASALGDPGFKDQVSELLQTNPKIFSYFVMGISAITLAARLRSIAKLLNTNDGPDKANDRAN